ncbi:TetR/AcrR family transcriptional regulator [Phytomonospora sp. NPDC050363]|uniref:TetR/AcrR family transcriptional regulator n=1 Tax=Phytomonospora sp. NPDC050363 TaxID=3155642 RepID=UPI0033CDB19A
MSPISAARTRGRPGGSSGAELLAVARQVFLASGYAGATMDAVASGAKISKQTLYRHYPSKDVLYAAVVRDWVDQGHDRMRPHVQALLDAPGLAEGLVRLARVMQAGILSPPVLQMRKLVANEAERFPEVAADYLERSWNRNQHMLAEALRELGDRGELRVADADGAAVAAEQLTWLAIAAPLNRLTLQGGRTVGGGRDGGELEAVAAEAVATFLGRFGAGE